MRLKEIAVGHFKHILNSSPIKIEPDITCLVGKNESGKTSVLEAMRRLKSANGTAKFDAPRHYPAWLEKRHRREGKDIDLSYPITALFELDQTDLGAVEAVFGPDVVKAQTITVRRTYANQLHVGIQRDEAKAVSNFLESLDVAGTVLKNLRTKQSFAELSAALKAMAQDATKKEASASISGRLTVLLTDKLDFWTRLYWIIYGRIPGFFYFSEYSNLPSRIKIRQLLEANEEDLDEDQLTAFSLLQLAGSEKEYLLNPDYETRKRELENVANEITADVLKYWSTNRNLRVLIDITQITETKPNGQTTVIDELQVRMYDDQHMLSLPFDERSSGFRWFFSFLAAFSRYEFSDAPVVILLDEPALGLHARAQKDFLRFIEERLSKRCQVVYTTHSPFMIEPGRLERVRLVEDKGREIGSVTTSDVLTTDRDTLFPLQSALGYDIAQHLFVGRDNLVLEGPSDFTYLSVFSDHLKSLGREGLNERWSMLPIGGADIIPAFVALLGHHLDVTVVVDSRKEGHQKLHALAAAGFLTDQRIIPVGSIMGVAVADIEDLFSPTDYLRLFNKAMRRELNIDAVTSGEPIVRQLARLMNVNRFDHNAPANVLLLDRLGETAAMGEETLSRFESLFGRINATLA